MNLFKWILLCVLVLLTAPGLVFADDPEYDPFYTKGVPLDAAPPIQGVFEEVDPFSGNLKIVQTDLDLPQNGGLELKIQRTYDSAIWSRRDTCYPGIVAINRMSPVGIGWTMHMGIVRNPWGNDPVLELPDGSRHAFYRDINDPTYTKKISKDFWVYKRVSEDPDPDRWEAISPNGIVYTFEYTWKNGDGVGYNDGSIVAQCIKIENPQRTSSISISYFNNFESGLAPAYSYIKSIVDTTGRTINFSYDLTLDPLNPKHQLKSISYGNQTFTYKYNKFYPPNGWIVNYLKEAIPPVGNSWKYAYEFPEGTMSWGQLAKFTYPTGGVIEYSYDDIKFATGIVSPAFRVITQRKTSGRDIPTGTWTYQYNSGGSSGDVTTITGPDGMKEVYSYYGWGNSRSGNVWRVGQLTEKKLYKGTTLLQTESYNWGAPNTSGGVKVSTNRLENADWNGTGGMVIDSFIWVPFLTSKVVARDGKTYTTTFSNHDSYGNPKKVVETGDKTRTTQLTYWTNAGKNIVQGKPATEKVTGGFPGSFTTSYTYDTNGNLTKLNKYGVITKYTYAKNGNLSKIIDANTKTWTYAWSKGRISKITNPIYSVSRVINANGTIAKQTNGRGYATLYTYDKNLRLTKVTPPLGNAISYTYPADSSYRKETRGSFFTKAYFDGFGRPTGSLNSKGVRSDIDYKAYGSKNFTDSNVGDKVSFDALERPAQAVHKDNKAIQYVYSGNTVTVKDEAGNSTVQTYNAFGSPDEKLLVAVKDANGHTAGYNYNILGSLTTITYGGITRSFGYNGKNFLTSESNPETGSITYGRDNVGNLTGKTDGTGTLSYTYDAINRLTKIAKGTEIITIGYDKADNRTFLLSPDASYSFVFDKANRLTAKNETILGTAYTSSYAYDGNDNLTGITYPGNRVVTYQYNGYNEVTTIPGFVASATYNLAGQPLGYTHGNGLGAVYTYNARYLPTGMSAGSIMGYTYGYDSRGNTVSITNGLDANKDQSFGYDKLNRITAFNGAWGNGSFTYDTSGNRLTKTIDGVDTTYNYASNRLTGTTGNEPGSYAYNTAGHLTSGAWGGKSYSLTYDGFNQVKSFTSGGTLVAEAGYDGDGLRIKKITADGTTVYHYDPAGNVLSEDQPDGSKTDYIYLNGKLLAKVDVNAELAEEVFFYHTDFAGTPLAMSDASGQKIWEADDKPFGEEFTVDGNGENDKRFVGKEKDEETGLNYFGARYLSAQTGRFLAPDPVRAVDIVRGEINASLLTEPQRLSTYTYSINNPYRFVDSRGLQVSAILDTKTNTLTITDSDKEVTISVSAFTGGHLDKNGNIVKPGVAPQTPASPGTYFITDNPNYRPNHPNWYGLLKNDDTIDDYFDNNRGGARLHGGTLSYGCVTIPYTKNKREDWNKVLNILKNTKTEAINYRKGPHWYNKSGRITKYGTLQIK
ncbi:RHS repeat protein [Syntrophotalea carbinolica DSM 2380]|uniref:RHS repeat protein n=1 Tax=Syntrophotalea carbinolica (strain DSM 2380 / NBRC 103641 / GraBd1) TaxID=338963 RepID=Q3A8A1_SYNC1|nr:RHS repeat-associated core domain-containing protein [Syntrophotalea carbinolica]ABA87391.2 RHS repeat protein [Syntrophotalea carbinolica DSM 2380]